MTVWTSAIIPAHPILAKQLFINIKIGNPSNIFPITNFENPASLAIDKTIDSFSHMPVD
jgi:hypothetical protein